MTPIQQLMLGVGAKKKTYMDDVFSTYLFRGNATSRSITNGIDLSGEGGMTWIKNRDATSGQDIFDTVRGTGKRLTAESTAAQSNAGNCVNAFNSNGFGLGTDSMTNTNNEDYASWSFRKAKGFFDVVTYTGDGNTSQQISHSLGCVPGIVIVKCTSSESSSMSWYVYHRTTGNTKASYLNGTGNDTNVGFWNNTSPTSTHFTVSDADPGAVTTNIDSATYVAYLFAGGESTAAAARSVEFDGTGDYFETNSSSDYTLGTGDFTLEYWIKQYESAEDWVVNAGTASDWGSNGEIVATYCDNTGIHRYRHGSEPRIASKTKLLPGQWNHVAIVRSSGTVKMYINGTKEGNSYSDSTNYTFTDLTIGRRADNDDYAFNGSLSNLRLVVGTAVYTSSFKPPTEPLTNITNTKLLCFNNSSTTGTTVGTITANGNPTASTDSPFDDPAGFNFGDAGDQNVIKCGSFTGNGSDTGPVINLGWEPQYILLKNINASENWHLFDSMRGIVTNANDTKLQPNNTEAENSAIQRLNLTPTGFKIKDANNDCNGNGNTIIYMAIRRPDGYCGKPAEAGTGVFAMDYGNASTTIPAFDSGFPVDFGLLKKPGDATNWTATSRLQGPNYVTPNSTLPEQAGSAYVWDSNVGYTAVSWADSTLLSWMWKRHAGFDVVTYDGNDDSSIGAVNGQAVPHSLSKTPEMIWVKHRSPSSSNKDWKVYHKGLNGGTNPEQYHLVINLSAAEVDSVNIWNDTAPTSTHFTLGNNGDVNDTGKKYIAMLFASVDGISKCGSYTATGHGGSGSGGGVTVTTGFSPRFILIKNISTGSGTRANWHVFDTTRGLTSGNNDPKLYLNTDAAQANEDWIDPTSTGFTLEANIGNDLNYTSGDKYIYYAHA